MLIFTCLTHENTSLDPHNPAPERRTIQIHLAASISMDGLYTFKSRYQRWLSNLNFKYQFLYINIIQTFTD